MTESALKLTLPCTDDEPWDFYGDEYPYDRIPDKPSHVTLTAKDFTDGDTSLHRLARLRDSLDGRRQTPRMTVIASQYDDCPTADAILMGLCHMHTHRLNANPEHPMGCNPLWVAPTVSMYGLSWIDRTQKHMNRRTLTSESFVPWVIIGPILEGHPDELLWIARDLYRVFHRYKKIVVRLVSDDPASMAKKLFRVGSVPVIYVKD